MWHGKAGVVPDKVWQDYDWVIVTSEKDEADHQ